MNPTYETDKDVVTIATSDEIKFENLPFGYYLVIGNYPPAATGSISVGDTSEKGLPLTKDLFLPMMILRMMQRLIPTLMRMLKQLLLLSMLLPKSLNQMLRINTAIL